jgi:hypothetical protein
MTHMTATEVLMRQKECIQKGTGILAKHRKAIQRDLIDPLIEHYAEIVSDYTGWCAKCYGVDHSCSHCGGTGLNRDMLRQTF